MDDPLRDRRFLTDLARRRQVIEIDEKIEDFDRLSKAIETDLAALDAGQAVTEWGASPVVGSLRFGFAAGSASVTTLVGHVEAEVAAVCQRCLEAFELPLRADLRLQLTSPDTAAGTRDDYEVWELSDALVCPIEIVDEALVMAMPLSARHEEAENCAGIADEYEPNLTTPFASLKAQMDEGPSN